MNISTYLFTVDKNYQPVYNAVLLSIPAFKELYITDESVDKSEYAKQLVYIWHTCDLKSPFVNAEFRSAEAAESAFGNKDYKPCHLVKKCQEEYYKRQSTVETRALDSSSKILNELLADIDKQRQDTEVSVQYLEEISRRFKEESDLSQKYVLMTMRNEQEEAINKRRKEMLDLIPKISDYINKNIEQRKHVAKIAQEIDSESNKDKVSNFLIHELLSKYNR